jgi:hypothetical protein
MSRHSRRSFIVGAVAGTLALGLALGVAVRPADADLSRKVIAAFKGQLLVTEGRLEPGGTDKDTIAAFKKGALTTLKGAQNGNDVQEWTFMYTAFLKSGAPPRLKLEFYNADGDYVADQTLTDVDPKMTVLEGDITINEDDGLAKGKKYTLKLTGTVKGKDVIFATSKPVLMD